MWWQYVLTVLLGLLGIGAVWGVTALFAIKMPYDGGGVKYLVLGLLSILATGIVVAFLLLGCQGSRARVLMLWAQWVMTVALGVWWLWWMSVALMVMLNWLDDVEVANRWAGVRVIVGCTLCAVLFTLFCAWIVVQFIWMQCVALCG